MLLDWVIAVGCIAACFVGGWLFVSSSLLQNYDDKETGVQVRKGLQDSKHPLAMQKIKQSSTHHSSVVQQPTCYMAHMGLQYLMCCCCAADSVVLHFCLLLQPFAAGSV
jgi:hypothetical protein